MRRIPALAVTVIIVTAVLVLGIVAFSAITGMETR